MNVTTTNPMISLMRVDDLEKCNLINQDLYDFTALSLYSIKGRSAREILVSTDELTDVLGKELMRLVECEVVTVIMFSEEIISHEPYHTDFLSKHILN